MHSITTYGGGELFFLVFNGIAALFNEDHTGLVMPMIRIGLMVGAVYVLALMFLRQNLEEGLRWLLWVVIATNLIFLPKTTILIHDPLTEERFQVDHVPLALGVFASTVSQVGKTVTETIEAVFTLPNYMPYHRTGTVFASAMMSKLGKFQIVDPVFRGNMERFVNQCVVYDAMIGHKYSLRDLQNTPDIWGFVRAHASPVLGFMVKSGDGQQSQIMTCREGADHLNDQWSAQLQLATAQFGNRVNNRTLTQAAFQNHLLGSARLFSDAVAIGQTANQMIQQEMMINSLETGSNNKLSELGLATNYASTKALLQQRSAYQVAGDIAARTLPLFKNVIEALSYALFIFIVVLALLPGGYRSLLTYFGILIWTQLWAPLYAVLNLIMSLYGKAETHSLLGADGLTYLNSAAVIGAHTDMMTLAAWFAVSIPFISYGILKQGTGAFVGLAHHLGSAMQSAASSAAAETVSGNISLGNVSMGTQAYQNRSAFQANTSPSYSASQFKALSSSGIEQSTFGEGTQTDHDHSIPHLPVMLTATYSTSREAQQRLHEAQSLAQSKSLAAGKSIDSAVHQTTSLLERLGMESSKDKSYSKSLSTSETQALQDHHNFTSDISEALGVSKARASELALHVKAGTPDIITFGLGVGAGTQFSASGSTSHQEQLQKAKSIAEQKGYSYSLDKVVSAAQTQSKATHDTKGTELAKTAQASLNEAQHFRDEASLAQSKVTEASNSLATSQRHDMTESRNITQEFLEYVAKQPSNHGPGQSSSPLGMKQAVSILKTGGAEYQSYLEGFKQQNPHYAIEQLPTSGTNQHLERQYGSTAQGVRDQSAHSSAYNTESASLSSQYEATQKPLSSITKQITKLNAENEETILNRKLDLISQQPALEKKLDDARDENVILSTFEHTGEEMEKSLRPYSKGLQAVHVFKEYSKNSSSKE